MQSFNIVKEIKPKNTFRVSAIISNFDLDIDHLQENFKGGGNFPQIGRLG